MPCCTLCNYKWGFLEVLQLGVSIKGKTCSNCGEKQYMSSETQKLFTLGFISLLFIPFLLFRIRLSDKEETLFD